MLLIKNINYGSFYSTQQTFVWEQLHLLYVFYVTILI